ncbi:protease Lon-related BREX system protein BrxL [Candidatus Poriferisodalis sp.]|uniref:protease Lon-related BREX system protein BrxL n=1 Tax=Candidatus Poriferisodalis sp. TaxID=3101277 RepID=UPI003B0171A4
MTETSTHAYERLDEIANRNFPGRVVRKDLVRQVKVGASVPVYVLEFLLGRYCASDDTAAIEAGLAVVNQTLAENFIRPDESEKAKAELKKKGKHRLIDKVDVRFVEGDKKFWATLHNFGSRYVNVPEEIVYKYDRLLGGGAWCQLDLVYNDLEDAAQKTPFYISALKPIQVAAFDYDFYVEARDGFSRDDWLDLIMRTVGLEPTEYDLRGKLLALTRLIPMAERNYNLIELGPWGTGKSFVFRESNPNTILISGGKVTVAQLFVNMSTGRVGLLGTWDVVAFDEVAGLQMSDSTVINMLKDFMESGSFARGKEEIPAEASIVYVGNTSKPHEELVRTAHLFADLPPSMIDPAFLDRLHYYVPGWETPKLEKRLFTNHFGFVSDYFAEALRQLRKQSYVRAIDTDFSLGSHLAARDEKAVRKTVSGLLKILHPHGKWSHGELREYLEFALEGRRRVKEQLRKLAAHDYAKTAFSYVENDTGREIWVDVPEQPEAFDAEEAVAEDASASDSSLSIAELVAAGESKTVEFKRSARYNEHTGVRDKNIERAVVKTVAGFMNAAGGVLLIGVNDDGSVSGIEIDYPLTGNKGRDGFENWLITKLEQELGKTPTASLLYVTFEQTEDGDICRVDIEPSDQPVYMGGEADFYVRMGNSTRSYNTRDALTYIQAHW